MNIAKIHNSIICDKRLPDGPFMLYCFMAMAVHPEYSLYQERKLTLAAKI